MAFPTVPVQIGDLSAVGLAKEATFGTPVTATSFAAATGIQFETTPGQFSPKVLTALLDAQVFLLYGEREHKGSIDTPYFPTMGVPLLVGAIGIDNAQTGTTTITVKNGTLASASAGATSLTYTVTNATPAPVSGDYFQIGPTVGNFGLAFLAAGGQIVHVTGVSGGGPYTLTVAPLQYAVATSAVAQSVLSAGPFYHNIVTSNTVQNTSFTIEKNLGNYQSLQFAGCKINKLGLKTQATNSEASFTCDLQGQSAAILDSPTAPSYVNESPFVFKEASLSIFGVANPQATNIEMDLENTLKPTWTFSGSNDLSYLPNTSRMVSGKLDCTFASLDAATSFGYHLMMVNGVTGALTFSLTHSTGESITITLNKVALKAVTDAVKIGDIIMETLEFTGFADLTASPPVSISAIISNNKYTAY